MSVLAFGGLCCLVGESPELDIAAELISAQGGRCVHLADRAALCEFLAVGSEAASSQPDDQRLEQGPCRLLLVDAPAPEAAWLEALQAIRLNWSFPALVFAAQPVSWVEQLLEAGASDCLPPQAPAALIRVRLASLFQLAAAQESLHQQTPQTPEELKVQRLQRLTKVGSFQWTQQPRRSWFEGLRFSESARQLLVKGPTPAPGFRALLRLLDSNQRRKLLAQIRSCAEQPQALVFDLPMSRAPRRDLCFRIDLQPLMDADSQWRGYDGLIQDISDVFFVEQRIRRLTESDPLTDLPNRRAMQKRIEQAVAAAERLGHGIAVLLIDLDRFKKVNDGLGHDAGDELLVEVAMRLRSCLCPFDQVSDYQPRFRQQHQHQHQHRLLEGVGRLGSDEFIALLPEISSEVEAHRVAAAMLQVLDGPLEVAGQELFATASIGFALFPQDAESAGDLIRHADLAMKAAKSRGRNVSLRYNAAWSVRGIDRMAMESDLHKALERKELRLFYQPQIETRNRRLVGAEALMRWERADGVRSPLDFIPLAEETGLIVALSEWALFEAARQAAQWHREFGWNQSIAVNLPSRMFAPGTQLPELVMRATQEAGIPRDWLVLEVTEGSLMQDIHAVLPMLHRLSRMGVQLSVDDFGTGYSSLHYLTELPLSELKIDRSFVHNMSSRPKSLDVIHLIISLARSMNLRVVAEGVEEIGQLARLRSMDCDVVQGYLFSRPMAGGDMAKWIHSQYRHETQRRLA